MIALLRTGGAQADREARVAGVACRLMLVLGYPSKLMQSVTNLTINATQAMPRRRHGDRSPWSAARGNRRVERLLRTDYIFIHVQDTGTGIRNADLGHIFDTFFTSEEIRGHGHRPGRLVAHRA